MTNQNLQRTTLRKLAKRNNNPLIPLRIEYSELSHLLNNFITPLLGVERVYPTHLPTQANGRWSTLNPPITNFPRKCINPQCQSNVKAKGAELKLRISERLQKDSDKYALEVQGYREHSWTDQCWSVRDILLPDEDEIMVSWDHDNIEGKIRAILLDDKDDLKAFDNGYDLHTINCCTIFGYKLPSDLRNPHSSEVDSEWRDRYNWQGKDTTQRVLAKNFYHGSGYAISPHFVYTIPGIESYGVDMKQLYQLAKRYMSSKAKVVEAKKQWMSKIQKEREARTLYGFRRIFMDSSNETAKEGFNHMISGTVTDYNNETLLLLEKEFGESFRFLHNAHDGDKIALNRDTWEPYERAKLIIERPISYQDRSLIMTADIKVSS